MLQVILVAVAVLIALSYVFASVAGESKGDEPAADKRPEPFLNDSHDKTAA